MRGLFLFAALFVLGASGCAQGPTPVIHADRWLQERGGLGDIASLESLNPPHQGVQRFLRVRLQGPFEETNDVQITIPNEETVEKGDVLVAELLMRGSGDTGRARAELLFERSTSPWEKSIILPMTSRSDSGEWRRFQVAFQAANTYNQGEAMVSIRLAFGTQQVDLADLKVLNYRGTRQLDDLMGEAAEAMPLGLVRLTLRSEPVLARMEGLGGNFCQPRYGSVEAIDVVGRYNLEHLQVRLARIGLPLNHWIPEPGVFREEGQARASLLALQEFSRRNLPTVVSVWEGPTWMLGGNPEQMGRSLPSDRFQECVEAIAQYLVLARDKYGVEVDYVSFNEPDLGVNFRFTPQEMIRFVRMTGERFAQLDLKTKFLVADTASGTNLVAYARPMLEDPSIAKYLGPISFHSWDALSATEESYRAIAALGREFGKQIWCLEAGHDPQLWQRDGAWATWENALRTAMAYARTVSLSHATMMAYWTYENNYPLVDAQTSKPFPVFHIIQKFERVLAPGSGLLELAGTGDGLYGVATKGPRAGQFSVLLANYTGPGEVTIGGLTRGIEFRVQATTSQGEGAETRVRADQEGVLRVKVPARSVVTLFRGG